MTIKIYSNIQILLIDQNQVFTYDIFISFRTLMRIFPNAKVVLTVRDPEKWYLSVRKTIYQTQTLLHGSVGIFLKLVGGFDMTIMACRSASQVHAVNKTGIRCIHT